MMPMTPENALYLAKQRAQDMLREAEADRLVREARRGSAESHSAVRLLAPVRAALAAIARLGQYGAPEPVKPVEKAASGARIPVAKPTAS
ncbi:MAG: hypothetical protein ACLQUY_15690 [Ktedonobacterales bacterium]